MKQRLCAGCGHRYSMSAKACPHCTRDTKEQAVDRPSLCDEPGCTCVATVIANGRRRCSGHYATDRELPQRDGPGYAAFKAKLEELRR